MNAYALFVEAKLRRQWHCLSTAPHSSRWANMTQVIDFPVTLKLRVSKKNFAFLTFQRMLSDNRVAAAISAVGFSSSSIRKRVQRLLSAFFMPQICYGSVRGRTARFAVSFVAVLLILRTLSPSYLAVTAAVNPKLRKETAHV